MMMMKKASGWREEARRRIDEGGSLIAKVLVMQVSYRCIN
jgi:hypothetical protein